jgi:hypothetical protein
MIKSRRFSNLQNQRPTVRGKYFTTPPEINFHA